MATSLAAVDRLVAGLSSPLGNVASPMTSNRAATGRLVAKTRDRVIVDRSGRSEAARSVVVVELIFISPLRSVAGLSEVFVHSGRDQAQCRHQEVRSRVVLEYEIRSHFSGR